MTKGVASSVLEVRGLCVNYSGAIRGLEGVNIVVPLGAITALLGPNGAGKTTLLRAVSGLLGANGGRIVGGEIFLFGERIDRLSAPAIVRRGLAQCMEGRRVFASLSVAENLATGAMSRRNKAAVKADEARILAMFPILAERYGKPAGLLSGGEQQMLAIGRALMAAPQLLLLDEPSLGLAPLIVEQIRDVIAEINVAGTSVLLVEQNATMALSIAQHAAVLEHGTVAVSGTAHELALNNSVRDAYLGKGSPSGEDRRHFTDLSDGRRWNRAAL